jgi:hypothetical protein
MEKATVGKTWGEVQGGLLVFVVVNKGFFVC